MLLSETGIDSANLVAERLRLSVFERFENDIKVTMSFGLPDFSAQRNTPIKIIKAADQALYQTKDEGKIRIITL